MNLQFSNRFQLRVNILQQITQWSQQNAVCPVWKTPYSSQTITPSYAQILNAIECQIPQGAAIKIAKSQQKLQ